MKNTLKEKFFKTFGYNPTDYFDCGGRFEILGNHTDHNHGLCLAATCDLAISSAIYKRNDNHVEVVSEGNPSFKVSLDGLDILEEEKFTSPALVRGVAHYFAQKGYKIGGFTAYMSSTIFAGAGVSSSAAFELLICKIFNSLYNEDKIPQMVMAKAGQYAENNYFGKKSGLLDQIGVGFGNISRIDFKDIANPVVEQTKFPFTSLHFVIVNTGGSHAALSDLYSAIPQDMYNAANKMGHNFLIEGSLEELEKVKNSLTDIEYTRALHFYGENKRVLKAVEALTSSNEQLFLEQINGSRKSSTELLKNMMVRDEYAGSPLEACDLAMKIMGGNGACKINGGGFAGSIICLVPDNCLKEFVNVMSEKYSKDCVKEVYVRTKGPEKM